jgi:adenosylcobinamide-phosphate synthase
MWADDRTRGAIFTSVAVGIPTLAATRLPRRAVTVALVTWTVLGARSLRAEGDAVDRLLRARDLGGARRQLTHLVGRDTSALDADEIARAALESVAENTCDAVVAPLFWGVVAGVPGMVGYRAINTLDAMVGYRSPRYARFGWASARLDDLANAVPARVTAGLVAVAAALTGSDGRAAWRVARADGRRHPSPNSGFAEAAFAGALGLRLGGRNVYDGRIEQRPTMGSGSAVVVDDLARATRLSAAVTAVAAAAAAVAAWRRG